MVQAAAVRQHDIGQQTAVAVTARSVKLQCNLSPFDVLDIESEGRTSCAAQRGGRDIEIVPVKAIAGGTFLLRAIYSQQSHLAQPSDLQCVSIVNPGNLPTQFVLLSSAGSGHGNEKQDQAGEQPYKSNGGHLIAPRTGG